MRNTRLPPLNALKAFDSAARHLSFTKAADELFVTQAAVSHQIKALEEHLAIKLFTRRNRSLLLTEEGQIYAVEIQEMFKHLQEATTRLQQKNNKGTINVSTPPSFASQWLIPRISQFSELEPDIDVRIQAVNHDEDFMADDIDIAIYHGRGRWSGMVSEKLLSEFLTPMCSPLVLNKSKPLQHLADLSHWNLLHDMSRQNWKKWLQHFVVTNVNVNKGPVFSHSMMVLQAAALGQGIALGNTILAKPELDAGRLVTPFNEKLESPHSFYVVCRDSPSDLAKVASFKDWLLSQAEADEKVRDERT